MTKSKTILAASEHAEQKVVVRWLTLRGHLFFAVPNGGNRNVITGTRLKAEGVKRGVPDLIICTPPPNSRAVATALEMKVAKGGKVSAEQAAWLESLKAAGWATVVGRGSVDAIKQLQALGY